MLEFSKRPVTSLLQSSRLYSKFPLTLVEYLLIGRQPTLPQFSRKAAILYLPTTALTCITSKIFERILVCNIMKHLESTSNNILYDLQFSFRQGRSCEAQLISLLDDLAQNYDKSLQTDLIITDFAKAFDVVPHRRLLHKLNWYDIRGNISQ